MRFICTLLAFLVLTLSVQPVCAGVSQADVCCTGDAGCTERTEHDDCEDNECKGVCNPLQSCGCCVAAVVLPGAVVVFAEPLPQPPVVAWGVFSPQQPMWPAYAIWQPPKIA